MPTQEFQNYRSLYSLKPPNRSRIRNDDEKKLLKYEDGVRDIGPAPVKTSDFVAGYPRTKEYEDDSENRHLWVIAKASIPYILEESECCEKLESRLVKHSNLTGGDAAHSGGEIWFRDETSFWLSGASGRYGPGTPEELETICQCFRSLGYQVANLGWDDENKWPARILRKGKVEFR